MLKNIYIYDSKNKLNNLHKKKKEKKRITRWITFTESYDTYSKFYSNFKSSSTLYIIGLSLIQRTECHHDNSLP